MKWWQNQPLIISAVQCNYGKDEVEKEEISDSILKEYTIAHRFNAEQLYHLTAIDAMSYYSEEKDGKNLDRYIKKSREAGIREIVYINVHCMLPEDYAKHPDWAQRDVNAEPLMAYEVYPFICVRSGWKKYIEENIDGLCKHDIDGIFLDGPVLRNCFCPACRKEFEDTYGKSLTDASYAEHLKYNIDAVTGLMRDIHSIVKSNSTDILLYINNSALHADVTGSNTRKVEPYVDVLGAEGGFVWPNKNAQLWQASVMAKIIETQAMGKPTVIFIAGDYKPWSFCMHTYQETKLYYAQTLANGANIWYGIHGPIEQMNTEGGRAAIETNAFINNHKDIFSGSTAMSKVALMWSQDSANYYASSVVKTDFTESGVVGAKSKTKSNHYNAFMGYYEVLMRSHIQHSVIDEESIIRGELSNFDVLILPTCACISDDIADLIREYAANGGNLISEFDTGFYNEDGTTAEAPKLADVQGFVDVNKIVVYEGGEGTGYQRVAKDCAVTDGLSWKHTPAPLLAIDVAPCATAQVNAEYCVPMESRYMEIPEDSYTALISNNYGKGKSVYFTGALGEFFNSMTHPDHKRMIENAVRDMAEPLVVTDAPGSVEVVLRKQNDRYFLHLINITGEMERPIQRVIPITNIKFSLKLDTDVSTAKSVMGINLVDVIRTKDGIEFTIPLINDYDIVIIS